MRPVKLETIAGAITVLALALCVGCVSGPRVNPASRSRSVDELFAQWNKPDSPGCAVAVIKEGKVVYERGYGCANLEYGTPITPSSVFYIASVSKQFTAMSVLLLVQQGRLSLDDDIRKHLSEIPDFGRVITIRHLIHHISGLRDYEELLAMAGWRMDDVLTREHMLTRADDWPQWTGPQRDGIWRESGLVEKLPTNGPTVLWRTNVHRGYVGPDSSASGWNWVPHRTCRVFSSAPCPVWAAAGIIP